MENITIISLIAAGILFIIIYFMADTKKSKYETYIKKLITVEYILFIIIITSVIGSFTTTCAHKQELKKDLKKYNLSEMVITDICENSTDELFMLKETYMKKVETRLRNCYNLTENDLKEILGEYYHHLETKEIKNNCK